MSLPWLLVISLAVLVVLLALALARSRSHASRAARARVQRALDGEEAAITLLEEAGYVIEAAQERAAWWMVVDGDEREVEVRADYVVRRDGRRLVAEVKTGEQAPNPTSPATRRQLLEYSFAFGLDGVLLVDVPGEAIHSVEFPGTGQSAG